MVFLIFNLNLQIQIEFTLSNPINSKWLLKVLFFSGFACVVSRKEFLGIDLLYYVLWINIILLP